MTPIRYTVRVNNFRRDHTKLLLEAFRPSVSHLRDVSPTAKLVFQPHWRDGPHVAFGVMADASSDDMGQLLADRLTDWASMQAPCVMDWDAFGAEHQTLAELERLPPTVASRSDDLAVMFGDFTPPLPRGHPSLGLLRDRYRTETLDRTLKLVEKKERSPGAAIVDFALTLALLEHVSFEVEGNPWPLSPQGQLNASSHLFASEKARRALSAVTDVLGSAVEEGVLKEPRDEDHVRILQSAHDEAFLFAISHPELLRLWAEDDAPGGVPPIPGMPLSRWLHVAANPAHFAYRFTVNHIYDTQPLVGMTVLQRLVACTALVRVLEERAPDVMSRAQTAGMSF